MKKKIGARITKIRRAMNASRGRTSGHLGVVHPGHINYEEGQVSLPGPGALHGLLTNFTSVSWNWFFGNRWCAHCKEDAPSVDFTGLQKATASEEVRELLRHMERIPLLRHEVLSFFYRFKLDHEDLVASSMGDTKEGMAS